MVNRTGQSEMLTRTERRFLQDPTLFSKRHARQHRYTIRKKVSRSLADFHLIIQNSAIVSLDLGNLESELEKMVSLVNSEGTRGNLKASSHMQTGSNPFSSANSDWGR